MARQLLEPILDNGVTNPFYFEGRLLTAATMREDQDAHRARQRHLGRALGPGVVEGLWVRVESTGSATAPPLLAISAGLAINGQGQTLELPAREVVALGIQSKRTDEATGLFRTCEPPTTRVEGTGEGFYVLVLSPASGFRGRAPASGLSPPRAGGGCGSRWAVEGVRLRLVPLDPLEVRGLSPGTRDLLENELLGATGEAGLSKLRNVVAHLCLGTEPLATFAADPFEREPREGGRTEAALADYGALDDLRDAGELTDCDVPVALVHLRVGGLVFADNWAVRRRLAPPATSTAWPTLSGGRRRAEAEAVLFQFQHQLAQLVERAANPSTIRARDYFRWLPPVGMMPVAGGGAGKVLSDAVVFDGIVRRGPVFIEGARLDSLIRTALGYPAFDLADPTMIWLYAPRENYQRIHAGGAGMPQAFLVFTNGQLPFFGHARFDVSRWEYASYSAPFDEGAFA